MQNLQMNASFLGRLGFLPLVISACIGLAATVALAAAPANDNFANAFSISGARGSTSGTNVNASSEPGEPDLFGIAAGESVWYVWTAPADGAYAFTTAGSAFDSMLGVYTGTSVNSLTLLADGYDISLVGSQTATFNATAGTAYHVQVDGYPYYGNSAGRFVLSWNTNTAASASSAGDFLFASSATAPSPAIPLYIASEWESWQPRDNRVIPDPNSIYDIPTNNLFGGNMLATPGARLTVTRLNGATGRVLVDYSVTNTFYTNVFTTNIFGTNVSISGLATVFTTNILVSANYQNNEYGRWVYLPTMYLLTSITGTNLFGAVTKTVINFPATNVPPDFVCTNSSITTTDDPPVTTQVFCSSKPPGTNIVASATPYQDYMPQRGELVFDDYQMSADILVTVIPSFSANFPVLNHVLIASITNVALAPLESTAIAPPTASTTATKAMLNILSQRAMVIPYQIPPSSGSPAGLGSGSAGTNVFNFERATLRCTESVLGSGVARVGVMRSTVDASQSTSVDYRIDYIDACHSLPTNWNHMFPYARDWEIPLQPGSDYAAQAIQTPCFIGYSDNIHFATTNGTLNWGANDTTVQFIEIPINNDSLVQFNEDILVQLSLPGPTYPNAASERSLGYVQTCNLTIMFDDQPAGAADLTYNKENYPYTYPAYNSHPGPNSTVYSIGLQADGRAIIGGDFTDYNGIGVVNNQANIYRLARVNTNGLLDQSFNTGNGANSFVSTLAIDSTGKVVIGGGFTSFNGVSRNRIARVNSDGSLDTTFAANSQGANGTVWALAINSTNVLIAGEFGSVNTFTRHYIARLLPDGTTDTSFNPGQGPDGSILALSVQPDGRIIIGGQFTHVDGVLLNHIARLNADGSLDTTFAPGTGFDGTVYALALQPDGNVVVGGSFQSFNNYTCPGLTRLDPFGNIDQSFLTGEGANDAVYALGLQPDGKVLLAGIFTAFNQTRRVGIARLFGDGTVDTSFMDTAYNQFAGVITHYWDPSVDPHNYIYALGLQPDGNILVGGSFPRIGGARARDAVSNKQNFCRLIGGSTPGPGNIGLVSQNYSANQTDEQMFVNMTRVNGHLGPASVTVTPVTYPTNNGVAGIAIQGQDFNFDANTYGTPTWSSTWSSTWHLGDGLFGQNNGTSSTVDPGLVWDVPYNKVWISLINNTNASGNRQFGLALSNPTDNDNFLLGGERIPLGVALGQASATATIVNPKTLPGVLGFNSVTYSCSENTNAVITVTRTNGITGLVSVEFQTLNGSATNLIQYRSNYTRVTFLPGATVQSVVVTNINNPTPGGDTTVNLRLYNPTGGATLGLSNAVLTIINNNIPGGYVQFSSQAYSTNENAGYAFVTVTRSGSSAGTLGVQFSTSDGTAANGVNYLGVTNTLTWNNGDVAPKMIAIPVLDDGVVETSNLTVNLKLRSATLNGSPDSAALIGRTNATLSIVNTDSRGQVAFSTPVYNVNGNGGPGYVTVVRMGGSAESITVNFAAIPGSATPGIDFYPTNGTLLFGPGEVSKTFTVPIFDNAYTNPPRSVTLTLSNATPAGTLGSPSTATITIIENGGPPGSLDATEDPSLAFNGPVYALSLQADGKLLVGGDFTMANGLGRQRMARLNTDGSLDQTFSSTSPIVGADAPILAMVSQTDGRILLGGSFTNVDGVPLNFVARVALNGAIDTTFIPGSGPNNPVFAVAETFLGSDRKLLIGGSFSSFGSAAQNYIGRLNDNGTLDTSFQAAANGNVYAIAVQPDGKAVIGGDFTAVNGVSLPHIARLNTDGSVDNTFAPGLGANDSVRAVAVQLDGRIVIGGFFTNVNGVVLNHIARLTALGAVDSTFTPGLGLNDSVSTIAIQPDTRIVLGGQFTVCGGVTRHRLTRLNNDGTLDTMINFGDGADSFVAALAIETNGMINLGGGFANYDDQPRQHLARIYGGTVAGAGSFQFTSANYGVLETAGNAILTVRRQGGTSGVMSNNVYVPNVSVVCATDPSGGTAVQGTNYLGVTNTLTFPPGEVFQTMTIPVIHDFAITPDLTVSNYLSNPMPAVPGGPAIGNQPNAMLTISNVDSAVSFSAPTYVFAENVGYALIPVLRTGSSQGTTTVQFATSPGTAIPFTNYVPVITNLTFVDGQTTNLVQVPLVYDPRPTGDKTVILQLSSANGSLLLNPFQATLTIQDVDQAPGQLLFSQPSYVVSEAAGFLPVTVLRTNGLSGTVQVNFSTIPGTASPGGKYLTTNGVLTFGPGQASQTFTVPILEQSVPTGNQTFSLVLSNATAGATLIPPTTVPVTIVDDKVGISFAAPVYIVSETAGTVVLSVSRQNATNQVTTVHYSTTNLTATAGVNYVGITNATLTFNPGETSKGIVVQVLHDPFVTGDLAFGVYLFNPSAPAQLFNYASTVVNILDVDAGLSFSTPDRVVITNADLSTVTNASYSVLKSGTSLLVTVVRTNANTGTVSVNYATSTKANDTAVAGVDYVATSGLLTFSNGVTLQSFLVPILNNRQIEGDRTFSIDLSNPAGGAPGVAQLIPPSTATVTITDDIAGINFSSANYRVNENGGSVTIDVLRSNYTNSTISVSYGTAGLTAVPGVNYSNVNGTLTFNPGDTRKTFSVPVRDDGVLSGDHTVSLLLSNLVGNALLVYPQAATLTILETDGSVIVAAGAALISESGPTNGVIDPGETVTLLFALRDSVGTNTANLVATLLATNGITNPSRPQNYGALAVHGPSVSRPFFFTASGATGQTITATFQLQDGSINRGLAAFNFTLGQATARFANPSAIIINDDVPATPYPSTINVSGLAGLVTKATVTVSNLNHTWPNDIDILLASPTGQKSYLMAKCGGSYTVNNVTLTFDDSAASSLPHSAQIVSGTNRPTSYALAAPPFPPALTPPPPYSTNLSVFNGNNPNGAWSLYVIDDMQYNAGVISNGWSLSLVIAGVVPAQADVGIAMTASPATVVVTSNLTYSLRLTNYGPSTATNIAVTDTLPSGMAYVSSSPSLGNVTTSAGVVTWSVTSLAKDAVASLTLVVQANKTGVITNAVGLTTGTSDPNPDDDNTSAVVAVVSPTADLALGLTDTPDPLWLGNYLTYTITVSNGGPATATGLITVDTLPPAVNFISASPINAYTVVGQVVTFTNLGNLVSGAQTNLAITVQPTTAGTLTDTASCHSDLLDPFKANNSASVKTIVQLLPLTVSQEGQNLVISWPANLGYYILESTRDLEPPAVWLPAMDAVPALVGGQITVVVPIGPGNRFFRLRWTSVPTLPLNISLAGANVILAWPINPWNCSLQSATSLHPPVVWSPVSSPSPIVAGGQNTVTLPIGSAGRFFRLQGTTP